MVPQGLIEQDFDQVLNRLGRVLILFLLLEIVLLQELDHLLTPWAKLAVELHHRHVLHHEVIGLLATFSLSSSGDGYIHLFVRLGIILLFLLEQDVLYNCRMLTHNLTRVLPRMMRIVLVDHPQDGRDVGVNIGTWVKVPLSSVIIELDLLH